MICEVPISATRILIIDLLCIFKLPSDSLVMASGGFQAFPPLCGNEVFHRLFEGDDGAGGGAVGVVSLLNPSAGIAVALVARSI